MYYEKRERKKQLWLYSIILWNCKYVTECSVFVSYEIKMENKKIKKWEFFFDELGKKAYFLAPLDVATSKFEPR